MEKDEAPGLSWIPKCQHCTLKSDDAASLKKGVSIFARLNCVGTVAVVLMVAGGWGIGRREPIRSGCRPTWRPRTCHRRVPENNKPPSPSLSLSLSAVYSRTSLHLSLFQKICQHAYRCFICRSICIISMCIASVRFADGALSSTVHGKITTFVSNPTSWSKDGKW